MAGLTTERAADTRVDERTNEAIRGTQERLRQPSMASDAYQNDERRNAITEAERLGRQALENAPLEFGAQNLGAKFFQGPANKVSASYAGPIVAETDVFSIQKINPLTTVRHEKRDLPEVPQVGDKVRINYSANVASIKPLGLDQERTRSRALGI